MKLELTKQCWRCDGEKELCVRYDHKTNKSISQTCDVCKGKGFEITSDGHQILDFLKKVTNIQTIE